MKNIESHKFSKLIKTFNFKCFKDYVLDIFSIPNIFIYTVQSQFFNTRFKDFFDLTINFHGSDSSRFIYILYDSHFSDSFPLFNANFY